MTVSKQVSVYEKKFKREWTSRNIFDLTALILLDENWTELDNDTIFSGSAVFHSSVKFIIIEEMLQHWQLLKNRINIELI